MASPNEEEEDDSAGEVARAAVDPIDSIFSSAKNLAPSDHADVTRVLTEAALAEIDPVALGDLLREIKAKTSISVGDLRKGYEKIAGSRKTPSTQGLPYADYDPVSTPDSLEKLLDEIADFLHRRVSFTEEDSTVASLWCAGTYGVRAGVLPGEEASAPEGPSLYPRLRINSGGPGSGKSTLLETLGYVAARAITADSITASAFFRIIESYQPSLFLDETDTWANGDESTRKVINSGHRRAGAVILSAKEIGQEDAEWEARAHRTFAPVALAGLGSMAATIEDRSLAITLVKTHGFRGARVAHRDLVAFRDSILPQLAAHGDDMAAAMAKGASAKLT